MPKGLDDFSSMDVISEFNIALANLFIIRSLLSGCLVSAKNLDPFNWIHYQLSLFKEVIRYIKDDKEKERKLSEMKKLFNEVNEYKNIENEEGSLSPELYWKLHVSEIYLREILNKAGVLDKLKDDPRMALTG